MTTEHTGLFAVHTYSHHGTGRCTQDTFPSAAAAIAHAECEAARAMADSPLPDYADVYLVEVVSLGENDGDGTLWSRSYNSRTATWE